MLLLWCHHALLLRHVMLTLLRQMEVLLWEVGKVRLWHHHVTLLLSLHDQSLCSLLGKTLVRIITSSRVSLSLWITGLRVLLVGRLLFDLSIGEAHMVLRGGDLGQVVVDLHVGWDGGRLAHRLWLRVPRKLRDLEGRELLLPALRTSVLIRHNSVS